MYCPRCSQQQVSEETKFCSRCGFPLGLVTEILAHGGFLPQLADLYKSKKLFTRRNGLIFSLFWFMIFMLLLILAGISGAPNQFVGSVAIIGTMGASIMTIASFLILKKEPDNLKLQNHELLTGNFHNLHSTHQPSALPPQQTQPANSYVPPPGAWQAPNTGDFVRPSSVTEGTTKLLEKDKMKN